MNPLAIAVAAFACSFGGAMLGMSLRAILPQSHLRYQTREIVKMGTGLIGTMAALILGLLVASASGAFDSESDRVEHFATEAIVLDRILTEYGPEAGDARARLRRVVATLVDGLGRGDGGRTLGFDSRQITEVGGELFTSIGALTPGDEVRRTLRSKAIQAAEDLAKTRWSLSEGAQGSITGAFVAVLMFWLAVLNTGFGLLSPRNATVFVIHLLCALSVAGAIALILDLDRPFDGLIRVTDDPLRQALEVLGR